MRVSPFHYQQKLYLVVVHQNITQRKLAEFEVLKLSREDELTGVANRRCFDEFIQQEWNRCARLSMPLMVALIDIDKFKEINDHNGHQIGDACLIEFGRLLKTVANRPSDLCARFGGDEFVVVWGNTSEHQADLLVGRLMAGLAAVNGDAQSPTPTFTVSIGLASMQDDPVDSVAALLRLADERLYLAKRGGRNQVAARYLGCSRELRQ
ncbi:GGDEF domain-containing protein [Ferrimonas pelagia]